jgi:hypothetical protein
MSLGRLWRNQGKCQQGTNCLLRCLAGSEGFDTRDIAAHRVPEKINDTKSA